MLNFFMVTVENSTKKFLIEISNTIEHSTQHGFQNTNLLYILLFSNILFRESLKYGLVRTTRHLQKVCRKKECKNFMTYILRSKNVEGQINDWILN